MDQPFICFMVNNKNKADNNNTNNNINIQYKNKQCGYPNVQMQHNCNDAHFDNHYENLQDDVGNGEDINVSPLSKGNTMLMVLIMIILMMIMIMLMVCGINTNK